MQKKYVRMVSFIVGIPETCSVQQNHIHNAALLECELNVQQILFLLIIILTFTGENILPFFVLCFYFAQ